MEYQTVRFPGKINLAVKHKTTIRPFAFSLLIFTIISIGCGPATENKSASHSQSDDATETLQASSSDSTDGSDTANTSPENGRGVVSPQKFSDDAFLRAAHDGNMRIIELALSSGTDIDAQDPQGHNALHMAAFNGHTEVVTFLLGKGLKIDTPDGEGKTALIHASSGPFAETASYLIEQGADVNVKDGTEGFTPLMMAAAEGQAEVVQVLLRAGADRDAMDVDGETAAIFAANNGHSRVVKLLEKK